MEFLRGRRRQPFLLDPMNACLWRGRERISLPPKDFAVLQHLVAHPGELVPKGALLEAGWPEVFVTEGVLKASINRIRKALGDSAVTPRFIETVHRRGYRFTGSIRLKRSADAIRRRAREASGRLASATRPMVGRDEELRRLQGWLARALDGSRQIVFVTGEAGLGKTTLVDAFIGALQDGDAARVGRGQCIEHYGGGEPYLPILEALGGLGRGPGREAMISRLSRDAPMWLAQMPGLLRSRDLEALRRRIIGGSRERMLRELVEALEVWTIEEPLVLLLEDLQWSDASTVDLIAAIARRREPAHLLLVGTFRTTDLVRPGHPLQAAVSDLRAHGLCSELRLDPLSEPAVAQYLQTRLPTLSPPRGLASLLYRLTEGHPLFMVAMLDDWLARGVLASVRGRWQVPGGLAALESVVPSELKQAIEMQLERLTPDEQRVLEAASAAGEEFSAAAVAAGLDTELSQVEASCTGLVRRSALLEPVDAPVWPDGTLAGAYRFSHAMYRSVAYDRVPRSRRAELHLRIGNREEQAWGRHTVAIASRLARHFRLGGDLPRAVHYHEQAARQAVHRCGYKEALRHADAGLELVSRLPTTPDGHMLELDLQFSRGMSLAASNGYAAPDVERAYARVRSLAQQAGDTEQLFSALVGLYAFYLIRGASGTAGEMGEELLVRARRTGDPLHLLAAHMAMGMSFVHGGAPVPALPHLQEGIELYDSGKHRACIALYGHDIGVVCLVYASLSLIMQGRSEQGARCARDAVQLAQSLGHPLSHALALTVTGVFHHFSHDPEATQRIADAAVRVATDHGFSHWRALAMLLQGWALAMQGRRKEGFDRLHRGLHAWRATGAENSMQIHWTMLAEAHWVVGEVEAGLEALAQAEAAMERNGEHMGEPELHRVKGELLLETAGGRDGRLRELEAKKAEESFRRAIDVARSQQARLFELRAAMSLARLWERQGNRGEARRMIAELYGGFSEGFQMKDLREARALLR